MSTSRKKERERPEKPTQDDCQRVLAAMEEAHPHEGATLYAFRHPSDGQWIAKPLSEPPPGES